MTSGDIISSDLAGQKPLTEKILPRIKKEVRHWTLDGTSVYGSAQITMRVVDLELPEEVKRVYDARLEEAGSNSPMHHTV